MDTPAHVDFIESTLEFYVKSKDNLMFIVGDNVALNGALARELGVSSIGCASHRFNLAMNTFFAPHSGLIARIGTIMTKCRSLKRAAALRKRTSLKPKLLQVTRWSGKFTMLERFKKISEHI